MSHHTQCSSTDVRHPGVLPEPNDCRRSLGGLRPDSTARPGTIINISSFVGYFSLLNLI